MRFKRVQKFTILFHSRFRDNAEQEQQQQQYEMIRKKKIHSWFANRDRYVESTNTKQLMSIHMLVYVYGYGYDEYQVLGCQLSCYIQNVKNHYFPKPQNSTESYTRSTWNVSHRIVKIDFVVGFSLDIAVVISIHIISTIKAIFFLPFIFLLR